VGVGVRVCIYSNLPVLALVHALIACNILQLLFLIMLAVQVFSSASVNEGSGSAGASQEEKPPLQQRILNGVLGISNVPYRSAMIDTPSISCMLEICT